MLRYLTILITLFCAHWSLAQTGTIKGTIKDAKTQEVIIGASAVIEGTTIGAASDIDGNFIIPKVPAGTHTLIISFVSYQKKTIPNLVIEAGKATVINTALDEESTALSEVTITAQRQTNTEIAVISEIRAVQQIAVGVSAEQIMKTQDRDAAQIARRVPGVSIVENRFVLVRGLSQRYNTVMINDVIAPSSEVDIRSFSFDMIPSNMIDRMLVFKSGAAELPGEFAGGVIKLYTKRAPEENFTNAGLSVGYRVNTTFSKVERTESGKLDFLGFDNGGRSIPSAYPKTSEIFNNLPDQQRASLANQMPNTWAANSATAPIDLRFNFNLGRKFDLGNIRIGNLTSLNYSSTNQFADVDFKTYTNGNTSGDVYSQYIDKQFVYNARLGLLHNWSFRFSPKFSLEFKNLFNQLGSAETVVRSGALVQETRDVLAYSERFESRSIYTGQLVGKNTISNRSELNWQLGYAYTHRTEPDWRRLRYIRNTGSSDPFTAVTSNQPNLSEAGRFFSELNENVLTAAVNFEQKLGKSEQEDVAKLKLGIYTEKKSRDFAARFFGYINGSVEAKSKTINEIFASQNVNGESGFSILEDTKKIDSYKANNTLLAGYASIYTPIGEKFNATLGLRVEHNRQELKSLGGNDDVDNPIFSPLPSLNLTYDLKDKQLIRLAYAYTVNRPEFRELAPFIYFDFNINANIIGNEFLTTTKIHNLDARWEYYPSPSELVSFGAFFKDFTNPIENFLRTTAGGINYTFVNAKKATSYGVEAELRKSLSELSQNRFIQNLSIVANASYIVSDVDLGRRVKVSRTISEDSLSVAGAVDQKRPMQNQSPYLVNAGLYYNNVESGLQINVLYNVFGKRIFAVGSSENPTIYEMPRHVIDLNITKTIGKRIEIRASFQDLLNQRFRLEQDYNRDAKIDNLDNQPIRTFRRGGYISLGFVYNFNHDTQTPSN
ncbi:MAG: TonB-dependent receptor [Bacteroidota bacterium]